MTTTEPNDVVITRRRRGAAGWVVAIIFALIYAFVAFEGLSNLIGVLQAFASLNAALSAGSVVSLVGLVVAPLLVFVVILWLTRRSSVLRATIMFIVGLALVAVVTLDLQNLFQQLL